MEASQQSCCGTNQCCPGKTDVDNCCQIDAATGQCKCTDCKCGPNCTAGQAKTSQCCGAVCTCGDDCQCGSQCSCSKSSVKQDQQ
eukprot:403371900